MHIEYDDFGSYEETVELDPVGVPEKIAQQATGVRPQ